MITIKKITTKELSKLLNVKRSTVSGWIKDGIPHSKKGNGYLFDPEEAQKWVTENCKGKRGKPGYIQKLQAQVSKEEDGEPSETPSNTPGLLSELAKAKLKKEQLQGEKLKLQVDELKGQYLLAEDVRQDRLRRIQVVKSGLLSLAARYADEWASINNSRILHKEIEKAVYELLNRFAGKPGR